MSRVTAVWLLQHLAYEPALMAKEVPDNLSFNTLLYTFEDLATEEVLITHTNVNTRTRIWATRLQAILVQ